MVETLAWIASEGRCLVKCDGGRSYEARFVHAATGQMPRPTTPKLESIEGFRGEWSYSSEWPADRDVSVKRVGVVGTGASGVQMVAGIAERAARLTVFQRKAPYLFPRKDREFYAREQRLRVRLLQKRLYRSHLYCKHEMNGIAYFNFQFLLQLVRYNTTRQVMRFLTDDAVRVGARPGYSPGCKRGLVNDY